MKQRIQTYFWDIVVNGILKSRTVGCIVRGFVLNLVGCKIDNHSAIHSGCHISGNKLELQKGSYINRNCVLDCKNASIVIGENVGIGFACNFFTTNHDYSNPLKRTGIVCAEDIEVGSGSWIGGSTTICPGVKIGKGCVIAAGSVVVKNCEVNCVYGGNPAKLIRKCEE